MLEDYEKKRRKQVSFMRSIFDYVFGILVIGVGAFFFFRDKFDLAINKRHGSEPNEWDKVFGIIFVAYGAWRIYRGYKKNYFKDDEK
jgi:hypothetical protein